MAMPFKDRYKRNKDILEWYDALAVAVAVIALVFTFGLRVVQVDGHSMQPTLLNGERLLMTPLKTPDYGDVVIVDESGAVVDDPTVSADQIVVMSGSGDGPDFRPSKLEILQSNADGAVSSAAAEQGLDQ